MTAATPEQHAPRDGAHRKRGGARLIERLQAFFYVGPAMLGIFCLSLIPIGYTVWMSLTNRNGPFRLRRYEFDGLTNYRRLLGSLDGDFYVVVFRTMVFVVLCIIAFMLVGLLLALILNNPNLKGRTLFRVLLIVPWAVPSYVAALIWKFFYNSEFGTINLTLDWLGFKSDTRWLQDPQLAFAAVVVINLWLSFPFFMVIILGALQSIPTEMYEAADVDGASAWRQLTSITLPMLQPAIAPAVILSAITTFQMFNTVWLVTEGGPSRGVGNPGATEFVMIYVYKQAFRENLFAIGSAFGMLIFILLFVLVLINVRLTNLTRTAYD